MLLRKHNRLHVYLVVLGIGLILTIDDRLSAFDRWSIIIRRYDLHRPSSTQPLILTRYYLYMYNHVCLSMHMQILFLKGGIRKSCLSYLYMFLYKGKQYIWLVFRDFQRPSFLYFAYLSMSNWTQSHKIN